MQDYSIVRTYSAGVFFGKIEERDGKEVVLTNSRQLHYWEGAAALSQLSKDGTSLPDECRFTVFVEKRILTECIEIIPCTEKAVKSIMNVKEWKV